MKKFLAMLFVVSFVSCGNVFAVSPTYYNPTASTMDFYPLMQHQMEKEATLDFTKDAENYKEKRAKKDAENEYRAGNKNFNPNFSFSKKLTNPKSDSSNMQFSTDQNGNIIIKNSLDSEQ